MPEISKINYPNLKIIFSGGTYLSKACNKIQKFSEDIDFRIHTNKPFTRVEKKVFCNFILEKLNDKEDYHIIRKSVKKKGGEVKITFSVLKLNMKNYMKVQI